MRTFDSLMGEYAESHVNPTNKKIHKIFVPSIMWSILGFFWAIPTPSFMGETHLFNFSIIFAAICLVYYFILNKKYALLMIPILVVMLSLQHLIYINVSLSVFFWINFAVFLVSWIFQFIGHHIEGKKPNFLSDLLFLLIGPLWVMKSILKLS